MNRFAERMGLILRGERACRMLERLGIDARRYWLIMDLLDQLSDRGEMMDQLGRDGVALRTGAWLYAAIAALISGVLLLQGATPALYLTVFVVLTAFVLSSILLSETSNSLMNPVEALVLAHQPIDGATYTAAKLSHLFRIVVYLVLAMDAIPAVCGLFLPGARWFHPVLHLAFAFATGLTVASFCCALFGWLLRFVPAKRLRAVGQAAALMPFLAALGSRWMQPLIARLKRGAWVPRTPAGRREMGAAIAAAAIVMVVLGLRSLSADYLVRVSMMMHGGSKTTHRGRRKSLLGGVVAKFFGGAPARAGFSYTRILIFRDWQFRRQVLPTAIMIPLSFGPLVATKWRTDPFSAGFSAMHFLPHAIGMLLALVCNLLPYGSDYKGAWVFLLAPDGALSRFGRGVYALLWIGPVVLLHLVLLPVLASSWGAVHAILFIAYSLAAASVYVGLELRLIEAVPFSKQADASRGATMMPVMIIGMICVAAAVGMQWVLFHSAAAVLAATAGLGVAAWFATRSSLAAFAITIRYELGITTRESTAFYKEVGS